MQVKAKEVLNWHPIDGHSYITQGAVYQVLTINPQRVMLILDDYGRETNVALGNYAHGVIWEVVDAS